MSFRTLAGAGALINWIDVPADVEAEFDHWYTFQHLPERVGTPGFARGRRFVAENGSDPGAGRFLALYETDDVDVLDSAPYLERLNAPTDWTRKISATFTFAQRAACSLALSAGQGSAAHVLTAQLDLLDDSGEAFVEHLRKVAVRLTESFDAVSLHLYRNDAEITSAKSRTDEGRVTSAADSVPVWIVVVELARPEAWSAALDEVRAGAEHIRGGADGIGRVGRYRLLVELESADPATAAG
ncbi:hypothetical protein [Pseudonocardia sp. NPDC049635]|uniref:hypothetical protein n=1 Tax=Pseudonocardia sp. NPDC049635 TaxID=3155506 RepID=UPI0033D6BE2B